jgi:two-component system phosphate regulon sensor histidine kinase PhoR
MFQIAIGNLIDNAIRYSKNAPIININIESGEDIMKISVSDNGIGIASAYTDRIFEKYFRIPTGDIHENEGFGLGLFYVRKTVRQMNGRIRVSSRAGKGTTFSLEFPLAVD